ncbi:hypothetical protein J2X72_004397 [Phyllobacterium sp. 1468]|nr:hypothetical protein [Phyllobacterium sp. 1468]
MEHERAGRLAWARLLADLLTIPKLERADR